MGIEDRTDSRRPAPAGRTLSAWAERVSASASEWTGRTTAFLLAIALIAGWAAAGPVFHYSEGWQLFINSITNLVTFLMVFLIQRAQNKDTLALQLKVNELLAAHKGAHNGLIAIEQLSEEELRVLQERFARLAELAQGRTATSVTELAGGEAATNPLRQESGERTDPAPIRP